MQFYYTGADDFLQTQSNIDKSIGGFISESPISNDVVGNLFSDISYHGLTIGSVETRAVAIKNVHPEGTLSNIYFWYEFPDEVSLAEYEFAFVSIPNQQSMEKIGNFRATPLYVQDFFNPLGKENKILITNEFEIDSYIGVWIRRSVDDSALSNKDCQELDTFLKNLKRITSVEFHFEFD